MSATVSSLGSIRLASMMVRQSKLRIVARRVKPAPRIARTSFRVKTSYGAVSATSGLIFVSVLSDVAGGGPEVL